MLLLVPGLPEKVSCGCFDSCICYFPADRYLGCFHPLTDGPQAMLRGALVYGGLMYLLSGNLRLGGPRQRPFQYEEKAIEF